MTSAGARRPRRRGGRAALASVTAAPPGSTRGGVARRRWRCRGRFTADEHRRELRLQRRGQHQVMRGDGARARRQHQVVDARQVRDAAHELGVVVERHARGVERRRRASAPLGALARHEAGERDGLLRMRACAALIAEVRAARRAGAALRRRRAPGQRRDADACRAPASRPPRRDPARRASCAGRPRGRRRRRAGVSSSSAGGHPARAHAALDEAAQERRAPPPRAPARESTRPSVAEQRGAAGPERLERR